MEPMSPVLPGQQWTRQLEIVFAKDQPQYRPLPAVRCADGTVVSRWRLTWRERLSLLVSGSVFLSQWTFNHPLYPVRLTVDEPVLEKEG